MSHDALVLVLKSFLVQANTALSKTNFEEALKIPAALGLSRDAANILSSAASLAYSVVPGG